ncbi:ABC transporter permease [Sinomicrobium weinanense]|uniref:ABC transporter permease n=1 Tax=Sinomicrobium weinanense TaxID=2842200 RepID=A0A926Q0E3_9FLAO|nr:ABC transporter permease [Sinomicrobium weinanense]MBC9794753.1 ABC transporter permease [Sinomicrobium weinanense]MBU3125012.1 ABC transporter permease [Sinomicrobium weinanense]
MIRNYFKIALRNLWKHKTFTMLNIMGLSVAFVVAILLSMTAIYELSYNKFHKKSDNTYLLYSTQQTPKGPEGSIVNPMPLAGALKEEVPGVASITRHLETSVVATSGDKEIYFDILYTDPDFFSIFTFPEIQGNAGHAIQSKASVALTQRSAKAMFGDEDAMGKTLMLTIGGKEKPFTVAAILKDITKQSSIDFEIAVSFANAPRYHEIKDKWDHWNHEVYLTLEKGVSAKKFEENTRAFSNLHFADDINKLKRDGAKPDSNGQYIQMGLFPFKDLRFITSANGTVSVNKTYPYLILGVAALILFIACVNFINMSIGTNAGRLREIGVRKTLGAEKKQLFFQFWSESVFVFLTALILGILFSNILLPPFKTLFRTGATFINLTSPASLLCFILAFTAITLLAGGYPAYILSKLKTVLTLKGSLSVDRKNRLRNVLVVVQFSLAILLISSTLVLHSQLRFMMGKDLGFNKEQVISLPLNGKKDSRLVVNLLRNELSGKPDILSISAADSNLGLGRDGIRSTSAFGFDYKGKEVKTNILVVDYDYLKTLDIQLAAGRSFDRNFSRDSLSLIINESMANEMGGKDLLNTTVSLFDSTQYTVVGIVKDYHFQDLNQAIQPITFFLNADKSFDYAYVKVSPENPVQSLSAVEKAWKKVEPNTEFLGSYLDENINRTLDREKIMTTIITCGSIIAIVLSCIGIFAISLLTIAQRAKEIGIRKVVGAGISTITVLLSKDFLKLVVIAFVVITPVSWWLMKSWLQNYSYRIDLSPWFFIAAGAIATLIAFATLSIRTIKAAVENPVKALKNE